MAFTPGKYALWLYALLVGLSFEQALFRVVPNLLVMPDHAAGNAWDVALEGARLGIYLILGLRFYAGSISVFDRTTASPAVGTDFVVGTIHFLFYLSAAFTLDLHITSSVFGLSHFALLVSVVLLYDLLWLILNRGQDTTGRIRKWTTINVLTMLLASGGYFVGIKFHDRIAAEFYGIGAILFFSVIDIAEIIRQKPIYKGWGLNGASWLHEQFSKWDPDQG